MISVPNRQPQLNGSKFFTMRFFKIVLLFFMPLLGWSQNSSSVQKSYLNGKDLYNSGQYALAIQAFKPLTTYSNTFSEYATFFYGLSSYYDGQKDIAKNIFLQLTKKYPNWTKNDEALLWLGKVYFEKEEYELGVTQLRKIRDRSLSQEVSDLKKYQLNLADLQTLNELNKQFPNDREIGESLARKMSQRPLNEDEKQQFNNLVDRFNLKHEDISNQMLGPTIMKDNYRVAICFPFMTRDIKNDRRYNTNQWVLDMYQGILLGQKKLQSQHVSLELFAYDTERDSIKTAQVLAQDELRSMDLIIGPLYPSPSELAASFSFQNKINIVNPLSSNTQIIANNPYSFLFKPGDETQAHAAAHFMEGKIDKDKKILVVYGSRTSDSVAAYAYQQAMEEQEVEIMLMDRIPTVDNEGISRFILDHLTELFGKENKVPHNIGHIYVASSDELIIANVIGTIDNLGPEITIMGNEDWLLSKYIDFKQLERLQVHLAAPGYMDYSSRAFKEFQKAYLSSTGNLPNKYSCIGYEMMLFFGKRLNQGGTLFQHELQEHDFYPGTLFQGYNYQGHNDNQYVPIVKFEEGLLTPVN